MNNYDLFSVAQIQEWMVHHRLLEGKFMFTRQDFIPEQVIVEMLQVTSRTMRTYRKKQYLHYIKFEGNIFYLRQIFYIDMLLLSQRSCKGD